MNVEERLRDSYKARVTRLPLSFVQDVLDAVPARSRTQRWHRQLVFAPAAAFVLVVALLALSLSLPSGQQPIRPTLPPSPSSTASQSPQVAGSPGPSGSPPSPVPVATALVPMDFPLAILAGGDPDCVSEGGCAAFFRLQPRPYENGPRAQEWRFDLQPGAIGAPSEAPSVIGPGGYQLDAHLSWVSDVGWVGHTPDVGGTVAECVLDFIVLSGSDEVTANTHVSRFGPMPDRRHGSG